MKPGAVTVALAIGLVLPCLGSAKAESSLVTGCMSLEEARAALIAERLTAPFAALRGAEGFGQGEAVGLQLCRSAADFVYDITLLQRDGRVSHVFIDARSGLKTGPKRVGR